MTNINTSSTYRIKELARQSGLKAPYGSDHEGLVNFDYRKFAELIVQDCVKICNDGWANGAEIGHLIVEHFGIKE